MRRRQFLSTRAAGTAWPRLTWADAGDPVWIAAARDADGRHALYGLDQQGADVFRIPLPARGRAAAAHPIAPAPLWEATAARMPTVWQPVGAGS